MKKYLGLRLIDLMVFVLGSHGIYCKTLGASLQYRRIDELRTVHSTHLREKIMDQVPGLSIVKKSGLTVAITMDDKVGRALIEACENSEKDGA